MTRVHPPISSGLFSETRVNLFEDTASFIRARQPDEPAYLMCPTLLKKQSLRIQSGFPGLTSFAVKANPHPEVIKRLYESGILAFDVASLAEIKLIYNNFPGAVMHFNNPVKAANAIEQAYYNYGVRSFVIDDFEELKKLHYTLGEDEKVEIGIRFKIPLDLAAYDFTAKFGASESEAVKLLTNLASHGYQTSLTFHPGSQCEDPAAYAAYIRSAASISRKANTTISRLNVGGGFPASYKKSPAPSLESYFSTIKSTFDECFAHTGTRLLCEPGRSMVAESCTLLTRVIHRRRNNTLFLNDGIYGGLMEQMLVKLKLPTAVWRDGRRHVAETARFQLYGPTCDSLDELPQTTLPKDLQAGDYIEFGCLGAYGSSTATGFNGFQSEDYHLVSRQTVF